MEKKSHDGQLLKQHVEKNKLLPARIAEKMRIPQSTLVTYYARPSLRTSVLWNAAAVLGYNFFFDIGMQLPAEMESALSTELTKRVEQLEKENERLKIENAVYEKILKR